LINDDGMVTDVTESATWATSDNGVVKIKKGLATATGIGEAVVTVSYGGCSQKAIINVK